MGYDDFVGRFGDLGVDLPGELAERCMNHLHPLPLVYVYERSDFSTKVYGLIVFPGPVREALEHPSVAEATTGKFTMITKADEKLDQFLEINIELRPQANSGLKLAESLKSLIVASLLSHNAEFRSTYTSMPDRVVPRIVLWPHEHPEHFKPGVKQKWVKECHGTK
jgi:phenylacetate-coenzyme A ligase PaaK-like adenylate-forming protein